MMSIKRENILIENDCLFCQLILKGENKLYEDNMVYMFKDIAPKAKHHYLIIPKRHMRDSSHIRSIEDMEMVEHMINVAQDFVRDAIGHGEQVQLHFHKPLFTMVKHLHMHVLVGDLTWKGQIFFCRCISNSPHLFTKRNIR